MYKYDGVIVVERISTQFLPNKKSASIVSRPI